jgi:hypothetical protein
VSYLNLLAQWDQKCGQAYTLASLPLRPLPPLPRSVPFVAKDDPLRRLSEKIQAMGLPWVMDPSEDTETGGVQ